MAMRSPLMMLKCRLDRWVNGRAILQFSDGQELVVARRYLPQHLGEGADLEIRILTETGAQLSQQEIARAVLKEILHDTDED